MDFTTAVLPAIDSDGVLTGRPWARLRRRSRQTRGHRTKTVSTHTHTHRHRRRELDGGLADGRRDANENRVHPDNRAVRNRSFLHRYPPHRDKTCTSAKPRAFPGRQCANISAS